jgi:hypothetical protein
MCPGLQVETGAVMLVDISGYSSFADRAIRAERANHQLAATTLPTDGHRTQHQHRRSATMPGSSQVFPSNSNNMFATESEAACVLIIITDSSVHSQFKRSVLELTVAFQSPCQNDLLRAAIASLISFPPCFRSSPRPSSPAAVTSCDWRGILSFALGRIRRRPTEH